MVRRNDPLLAGVSDSRLDTEVGFGPPIGRKFVATPRAGVWTSAYSRDYPSSYGVEVLEEDPLGLQLGVEAERRVSPAFGLAGGLAGGGSADQRVLGQASIEW